MLTLIWVAGIAWGSLSPASDLPQHLPWDKLNHFIAYAGLAAGLRLTGRRWMVAWGVAVIVSIVIEVLQIWVPGRHGGDWGDILANALGAGVGLVGLFLIGKWIRYRNGTQQ
ncbi:MULTISPECIES: VanZ family protein [Salinicola]|nr:MULTISPECIES: VanZ family protein [Salinicola]